MVETPITFKGQRHINGTVTGSRDYSSIAIASPNDNSTWHRCPVECCMYMLNQRFSAADRAKGSQKAKRELKDIKSLLTRHVKQPHSHDTVGYRYPELQKRHVFEIPHTAMIIDKRNNLAVCLHSGYVLTAHQVHVHAQACHHCHHFHLNSAGVLDMVNGLDVGFSPGQHREVDYDLPDLDEEQDEYQELLSPYRRPAIEGLAVKPRSLCVSCLREGNLKTGDKRHAPCRRPGHSEKLLNVKCNGYLLLGDSRNLMSRKFFPIDETLYNYEHPNQPENPEQEEKEQIVDEGQEEEDDDDGGGSSSDDDVGKYVDPPTPPRLLRSVSHSPQSQLLNSQNFNMRRRRDDETQPGPSNGQNNNSLVPQMADLERQVQNSPARATPPRDSGMQTYRRIPVAGARIHPRHERVVKRLQLLAIYEEKFGAGELRMNWIESDGEMEVAGNNINDNNGNDEAGLSGAVEANTEIPHKPLWEQAQAMQIPNSEPGQELQEESDNSPPPVDIRSPPQSPELGSSPILEAPRATAGSPELGEQPVAMVDQDEVEETDDDDDDVFVSAKEPVKLGASVLMNIGMEKYPDEEMGEVSETDEEEGGKEEKVTKGAARSVPSTGVRNVDKTSTQPATVPRALGNVAPKESGPSTADSTPTKPMRQGRSDALAKPATVPRKASPVSKASVNSTPTRNDVRVMRESDDPFSVSQKKRSSERLSSPVSSPADSDTVKSHRQPNPKRLKVDQVATAAVPQMPSEHTPKESSSTTATIHQTTPAVTSIKKPYPPYVNFFELDKLVDPSSGLILSMWFEGGNLTTVERLLASLTEQYFQKAEDIRKNLDEHDRRLLALERGSSDKLTPRLFDKAFVTGKFFKRFFKFILRAYTGQSDRGAVSKISLPFGFTQEQDQALSGLLEALNAGTADLTALHNAWMSVVMERAHDPEGDSKQTILFVATVVSLLKTNHWEKEAGCRETMRWVLHLLRSSVLMNREYGNHNNNDGDLWGTLIDLDNELAIAHPFAEIYSHFEVKKK